ncbi:PEP-CTERM sorting domain-containing protein [Paucibacter sediminis]|uniref:PEP-CTERM sorting domain-containing protein n=1 Tax=Paucibacter sediminis TaxID=3019553 RepID=A0AA95NGJ7_9BURK|nr:PEP-CTERM sorting domain-containing protein [Paucibacter sp. S2-9]WIT10471.1 PEP-CTERM sorting domain-containing protein [Paucibacter sp. S2-9]
MMTKYPKRLAALAALCAALACPAPAMAGYIWNETGLTGAGDGLATAQVTFDSSHNSLSQIHGMLSSSTAVNGDTIYQVDLYQIRIDSPGTFSAWTTLSSAFDTQLFLFDAAGMGVYSNDDDGVGLTSLLPAGDPNNLLAAGVYYLAIAFGGFSAADGANQSVFLPGAFTDLLTADPGSGALNGWMPGFAAGTESAYSYDIFLTGATNAAIPEPASLALVLLAGLGVYATRRRQPRQLKELQS